MSTLASVVLYGTAASIPSASIPGRIYYTSDTEQIFRDNGTSWDNVTPALTSASITAIQQQSFIYAADTGAANAYVVSLTPSPALAAGSAVLFNAANTNTGASTLNVNGGGAIAITKAGSTALSGGEITAGQIIFVTYDGTEFQIIGGAGSGGGSGPTLQTNGSNNASQTLLNLIAGTNISLTNSGGGVTIDASGGGGGGLFAGGMNPQSRSAAGLTTNVNQQSDFTMGDGSIIAGFYLADSVTSGPDEVEGIVMAYPGSAFQLDVLLSVTAYPGGALVSGGSQGTFFGIAIMNTTTGHTMLFGMRWSGGHWQIYVMTYSTPSSYNSSLFTGNDLLQGGAASIWLRLVDDGTNLTFEYSTDGIFYQTAYGPVAKSATYLGSGGFNYIGPVIDAVNNPIAMSVPSWDVS